MMLGSLAEEPSALTELHNRLHCDPNSGVRRAAARALGAKGRRPNFAMERLSSIARVVALIRAEAAYDVDFERVRVWLEQPLALDLDAEPDFGELVLAWVCVRLAWASADGGTTSGRVFGEVERPVDRLVDDRVLVIRVAMDVSELPRERELRPTFNLVEAWKVAQHLHSSARPTVVLACADVGFEHLAPPPLEPGETLWGPTFFGFRLQGPLTRG